MKILRNSIPLEIPRFRDLDIGDVFSYKHHFLIKTDSLTAYISGIGIVCNTIDLETGKPEKLSDDDIVIPLPNAALIPDCEKK